VTVERRVKHCPGDAGLLGKPKLLPFFGTEKEPIPEALRRGEGLHRPGPGGRDTRESQGACQEKENLKEGNLGEIKRKTRLANGERGGRFAAGKRTLKKKGERLEEELSRN